MIIKNTGDKKVIELHGKVSSPYSIFSIIIALLLTILCGFLILQYHSNPVVVLSALFIPLVVLVFLLKIVIWNIWGSEIMVFGKQDLRVFYDYKFIYNKVIKNYNFKQLKFKVKSNASTDSKLLSEEIQDKKSKTLYKIIFDMGDEQYQSSFSIKGQDLERLKELIRS